MTDKSDTPKKVARWTSAIVSPNEHGGFVAYGDYLTLEREVTRLTEQVAALKGDTERLQWLQEHYAYVMLNRSSMKQMIDPTGTGNLRAAIDAAIAEGKSS